MARLPIVANARFGTTTRPGKGGHRHVKGRETPYRFVDRDELQADFWRLLTNGVRHRDRNAYHRFPGRRP
jgi:hypothetical protein